MTAAGVRRLAALSFALPFQGQTSWHTSHPNAHGAILSSAAIGFHCSIVRYGMQRRASITPGATNASVGHECRQRSQLPQRSGWGESGCNSAVVSTTPRKIHDP